MDERTRKWVFRILYAVGIIFKAASWIVIALSILCIVNGNNWLMVIGFVIGVFCLFVADGWLQAVEERMANT